MVIDCIRSPMDDDLFDRLAGEVSDEQQAPTTPIHTRWNEDGTYKDLEVLATPLLFKLRRAH